MTFEMNRREALTLGAAALAALTLSGRADARRSEDNRIPDEIVRIHDERLQNALARQVTDPASRYCGAIPDEWDLHHCTGAAGLLRDMAAAYFQPKSRFHASGDIANRMKLAAGFLVRSQNADGFIDLLVTNFGSPPDTAFALHSVATAAALAKMNRDKSVLSCMKDFLTRAGDGLAKGGIHTPNHRWAVSEALAQINALFPERRYRKRIEEWLAEGIDIDEEGQYTERSTSGYNAVVDNALVVIAHKLDRPELLNPVRRNLDAMAFLLHPNGEVVTEISRRQDLNTRGTMSAYWFALRYMAVHDRSGLYAAMLGHIEPAQLNMAAMMEYPGLQGDLPAPATIPDNYERDYPGSGISRIRRGRMSATIIHKGNSRWASFRNGDAVINAVRFATSFFGKGQFVPAHFEKKEGEYRFSQEITGRYLQPLSDATLLPVTTETWPMVVERREKTEICRLNYETSIRETDKGFELHIIARGTDNVPLAVEINFREGGQFTGVVPAPNVGDAFLLKDGFAEYRAGNDMIRFGPGQYGHAYTQVRGGESKLSGQSVYLTGFTPFEHTIQLELRV